MPGRRIEHKVEFPARFGCRNAAVAILPTGYAPEEYGPNAYVDFLSEAERALYDRFRFEKRRREWLAGRFAAKGLVLSHIREKLGGEVDQSRINILPREDRSPGAYLDRGAGPYETELDVCVSISHRSLHAHVPRGSGGAGIAAAALVASPASVGIDVELVERRAPVFVRDYFTDAERDWMGEEPASVCLAWSAKEAVLKVFRTGLGTDPRKVEILGCDPAGEGWAPIQVRFSEYTGEIFAWRLALDDYVITLAAISGRGVNEDEVCENGWKNPEADD